MHFSIITLLAGVVAVSASAIPAMHMRRGGCSEGQSSYSCSTFGAVNALQCVNAADGSNFNIPVTLKRGVEERNMGEGQYCCEPGVVNVANCVNAADGSTFNIPVSLLRK